MGGVFRQTYDYAVRTSLARKRYLPTAPAGGGYTETLSDAATAVSSVADLQAYVESVLATIQSGSSVTDTLIGLFRGSYVLGCEVPPRLFIHEVPPRIFIHEVPPR